MINENKEYPPLISIIIPTHNRACYAVKTIESALSLGEAVEVIVTDTSDKDNISHHFNDKTQRLNYIKVDQPLSVVDNFSLALSYATGDYLVFIGDDDFVTKDIINIALWANENQVDSLKFTFPASYFWPDFKHKKHPEKSSSIELTEFTGKIVKHDAKACLDYCLTNLGAGPSDMPRAYLGMFSRALSNKITNKYGAIFGGVSPDIFSAAMISEEATSCFLIDYPVIIPGSSGASTSGLSAAGKHIGTLWSNPHISAFKDLVWDKRIPEFYSVQTVWSFSLLKASEKHSTSMSKISFTRLYVKCFLYQTSYWRYTMSALKQYLVQDGIFKGILHLCMSGANECFDILGKIYKKYIVKEVKYKSVLFSELSDVVVAQQRLESHLKTDSKIKLQCHLNLKN